ncbi:MAG: cytidylate kinase family protein [Alphaproteobacteria bacterium]|nr:cytidylate kinase family protein [Alphaproteobacteria bacterium]
MSDDVKNESYAACVVKYDIVTISGALGSGKSTIMKMLANRLGYETYSTGAAQREIAKQYGVTTLELNHIADKNPDIDKEIDGVFKTLVNTGKKYVVDSRLAFFFIPTSFKIKLNVDVAEAAHRILKDKNRTSEVQCDTLEQMTHILKERRASEVARFIATYKVNIDEDSHFDLIIDTTDKTPDEICDIVLTALRQ